jgi:serine/threonine protein kinase
MHPHIQSDALLRGILFNKGVIYEKEDSNLQLEIEQRKRSFKLEHFTEEEILNTFLPLFTCLQRLHQEGIIHRAVTLQNIVIIEGEVKLRDWLAASYE